MMLDFKFEIKIVKILLKKNLQLFITYIVCADKLLSTFFIYEISVHKIIGVGVLQQV